MGLYSVFIYYAWQNDVSDGFIMDTIYKMLDHRYECEFENCGMKS